MKEHKYIYLVGLEVYLVIQLKGSKSLKHVWLSSIKDIVNIIYKSSVVFPQIF